MNDFWNFFVSHVDELAVLVYDHMRLTLTAVSVAIVIGVPLGILIASVRGTEKPILGFANIMQAVPSLAALGLLVPFIGIGSPPAILMVVLYSLLPVLKNTYTGIKSINPQTIEAAKGIGMTPAQVLVQVKIPLALPVLMSGIRIAAVTAVGLMTIAAYIGAGGLGNYVISGIQTSNTNLMLSGAIPACVLALLMDFAMGRIEKAVVPISLTISAGNLTKERIRKGRLRQKLTIGITAVLLLTLLVGAITPMLKRNDDTIVVSSKPEVEGLIVGNIIAELIESNTDLEVERRLGLGATSIIYNALVSGEIDVYPEYSGSVYSGVFGMTAEPGMAAEEVVSIVRDKLSEHGIVYMGIYGLNNRYSLGVLPKTAEQYGLKTISDLEGLSHSMSLACDQEFLHRADGIPALQAVYTDLEFEKYLQFQGTLMYEALMTGDVEVMTPFTTDALLAKYDITVLEDDKSALSNYHMATAIRQETLEKYPELADVLSRLENNISDEEITKLNYEVVVNERDAAEVARQFLQHKGLISSID